MITFIIFIGVLTLWLEMIPMNIALGIFIVTVGFALRIRASSKPFLAVTRSIAEFCVMSLIVMFLMILVRGPDAIMMMGFIQVIYLSPLGAIALAVVAVNHFAGRTKKPDQDVETIPPRDDLD